MELVRKFLTADEIGTPTIRWNSDCDCVQQSPDGGATWVDVPQADPRSATGYAMPPASSADPQCDGAARMVAALKRLIDIVVSSAGTVAAVSAVLGYLTDFIFGIGTLVALILEAVTGLLALGQDVLNAAFTTDVYSQIECLAYSRIGLDGHFDNTGWGAFTADVLAAFSGTVNIAMGLIFQLEGINGFNNAASVGTETGDCTACCHDLSGCFVWDFGASESALGWGHYAGHFDSAPYWMFVQTCAGGLGSDSAVNPYQSFPTGKTVVLTRLEMDIEVIGDPTHWQIYRQSSVAPSDIALMAEGDAGTGIQTVGADISADTWYGINLLALTSGGCGTGDVWVHAVRVFSDDFCPLGVTPNC